MSTDGPKIETPIRKLGFIECDACGETVDADLSRPDGSIQCVCGKWITYGQEQIKIPDIFELFGYRLSLDWDGQLIVHSEKEVPESVAHWLFDHQGEIRQRIEWSGRRERAVFVGGTFDRQRHGYYCVRNLDGRVYKHLARAHWETYEFRGREDPRLFFLGRSTSKAKAKRGCFVEA